jgi:hypothetical protein
MAGWTFGEAVYAALPVLSWQTTVVGDPLYRPFGRAPGAHLGQRFRDLHFHLVAQASPLLEWSHLHVVNLGLGGRADIPAAGNRRLPPAIGLRTEEPGLGWKNSAT